MSTQDILMVRHNLKVVGVDAVADAAQMVEFIALRDVPDKHFEGEAMSQLLIEGTVTASVTTANPQPAILRQGNVRGESHLSGDGAATHRFSGVTVGVPPAVMRSAVGTRPLGSATIWDATLSLHRKGTPFGVMGPDANTVAAPFHYTSTYVIDQINKHTDEVHK